MINNINLTEAEVQMIQKMREKEAKKAAEAAKAEEAKKAAEAAKAEEAKKAAEAAKAEEAKKAAEAAKAELIGFLCTAPKADTVIVSAAAAFDDEFNSGVVKLITSRANNMEIGFFVGVNIMKDNLNNLIELGDLIKSLKNGGLGLSSTLDNLLDSITKFC